MDKTRHALRIAVGITMLAILLTGVSSAAILTVNASGGGDYTKIQDAINASNNGDTIIVAAGTYKENVDVNKSVNLVGAGVGITTLNASNSYDHVFNITTNNVNISGFTIVGSISGSGIFFNRASFINISNNNVSNNREGIYADKYSNNNSIINNDVSNNNNYGIFLSSSSNNTLKGNNASNNNNGIFLSSSNNNTLIGNMASKNYHAFSLSNSSNNTLTGNTASNNDDRYPGIDISYSSNNNTLMGNNVSNNGRGISLRYSSNNTMSGNNASNNIDCGIYLFYSSNNTLTGNTASNNNYGIILESSSNNKIYNNIFNNTIKIYFLLSNIDTWDTTRQSGTNIIGGLYLGGNFWGKPDGTGFSQICADVDNDGICDSAYVLDANNIDYLPLAMNFNSTGRVHNINKDTNYFTIQSAIDDANTGDEIHVDSGTYHENVNVNKRLILRGFGMPVVDAVENGSAITLAVDGMVLDGFTATGASGSYPNAGIKVASNDNTLSGNNASSNNNYGILLLSSSNNTLSGNLAI